MRRHHPRDRVGRRTSLSAGLLLAAAALVGPGLAPAAGQATYVVTTTGEGNDTNTADGVCANSGGECTLRAAVQQANATPGLDSIHFDIPGNGPHTIGVTAPLAFITDPVVIDGFTQPGSSANTNGPGEGSNAVLMIVLDALGAGDSGLDFEVGGSTVRGLRFVSATNRTIQLAGTEGGSRIEGIEIVSTPGDGIIVSSPDNIIGGTDPAARNVISPDDNGIYITASSGGNLIQGNLIGTDPAGTAILTSVDIGVYVHSDGNIIGGTEPGAGNVIAGGAFGIAVETTAGKVVVQGNLIGTDVTGTADLGNGFGIAMSHGTGHEIGGTTPEARNVISGNDARGIYLAGTTSGTLIRGNYVGVDITGTAAIPNTGGGILVSHTGHTVGGTAPGAGNVISGNGGYGVFLATADDNTVQGNLIGTDAAGTAPIPNLYGLGLELATGNLIGGPEEGAGNVIAASHQSGLLLMVNSMGNVIQGNLIGTDASGSEELGNGVGSGMPGVVVDGVFDNTLEGNTIAFSGSHGIRVVAGATGNRLTGNILRDNGGLGIDLEGGADDVTPNDPGDGDTGANNLQNFPLVTLAYLDEGTVVEGTLNSAASTEFTLEFFASAACDPSDHGEAAVFLGSAMVTTDGDGNAGFIETLATAAEAGEVVAATATDPDGNTSELSACVRVNEAPTYVVTTTDDATDDGLCSDGHCMLREAIAAANAHAGTDRIHFDIPGEGPHLITLDGNLPELTDAVVLDGFTQPGASPNTNGPDQGTNATILIEIDADNTSGKGLHLTGGGATVRGLAIHSAGDRTIWVTSDGNVLEGNFLGTNAAGNGVPAPGGGAGVQLQSGAGNRIGGTAPAARNLISGAEIGVQVDADATGTIVHGNLIGTDASGTAALANEIGVALSVTPAVIGGAEAGAGNLISGNTAIGVLLKGTTEAVIQGNAIGTDAGGAAPLANGSHGIYLQDASSNVIEGNTVAFNGGGGVVLLTGVLNTITANAIHDNAALGIDIAEDGVTENDEGDGDDGPNARSNFPELSVASVGSAVIEGTFSGQEEAGYRLEFFSSDACDASGYGQGQRYLGSTTVTTDGSGSATFTASLDGPASPGDAVTATATHPAGHTSEFSACVTGVGYDVAVEVTEGTVARGRDATYDVTVTALAGTFDRDVALSCDGLPDGTSCSFAPAVVQPGDGSATATLVLSTSYPDTPTGASDFTVVGTYDVIQRSFATEVVVTDFTVAVSPEMVTVPGGNNAGFTVTVAADGPGFAEPVTLTCADLPAGASCSFSPAEVTPGSDAATSTLTLSTVPLEALSAPAYRGGEPFRGGPRGLLLALACLFLAGAFLAGARQRPRRVRVALGVLLFVVLADVACGDTTGPPDPPDPVTTTFTITGTSGELVRSATAAVTVE